MLHNYRIKFTSHNLESIKEIDNYLKKSDIKNKTLVSLPKKKKIFTLIKSPHVNNKSKEHFKIEKYKRLVCLTTSSHEVKTMLKKLPNDLFIKVCVTEWSLHFFKDLVANFLKLISRFSFSGNGAVRRACLFWEQKVMCSNHIFPYN